MLRRGQWRAETLIGKFLAATPGARGGVYIATKLGRFSPPGWPANFTRAGIRQHTEASLNRLGVEALDLTQFHCIPSEVLKQGEVFEHVRELKREGKIRDFGVSVESMEEALYCARQDGVAALQIIFNIFRQKPIHTLFAEAKQRNVALLVRLPLASGLLGGKMTKTMTFPARKIQRRRAPTHTPRRCRRSARSCTRSSTNSTHAKLRPTSAGRIEGEP